jgi:hypothetical protein
MKKIEVIRLTIAVTGLLACTSPVAAQGYPAPIPTQLPAAEPAAAHAPPPVIMYPPPPPPDPGAIIGGVVGGLVGGLVSLPFQVPGAVANALAPLPANRAYVGPAPGWAWDSLRGWVPIVPASVPSAVVPEKHPEQSLTR